MQTLKWCVKQIFPLTYVSTFRADNKRQLCIWKMWLGRSYKIKYFNLEERDFLGDR